MLNMWVPASAYIKGDIVLVCGRSCTARHSVIRIPARSAGPKGCESWGLGRGAARGAASTGKLERYSC